MQDQVALSLWTMLDESRLSQQGWEYLELRCNEELVKLKSRIAMKNIDDARQATAKAHKTHFYAAQIACASALRVPPSPMSHVTCLLPLRPISLVPDVLVEDVVDGDREGNKDVPMQFKDSEEFVEKGSNGVPNPEVYL